MPNILQNLESTLLKITAICNIQLISLSLFDRIVDNMPVTWCYEVEGGQTYCSPGFPVGCYVDKQGRRKDACVIDVSFY